MDNNTPEDSEKSYKKWREELPADPRLAPTDTTPIALQPQSSSTHWICGFLLLPVPTFIYWLLRKRGIRPNPAIYFGAWIVAIVVTNVVLIASAGGGADNNLPVNVIRPVPTSPSIVFHTPTPTRIDIATLMASPTPTAMPASVVTATPRPTATPMPTPTVRPTSTPSPTVSPQVELATFRQSLLTSDDLPELELFDQCLGYIGGSDGLYLSLDSYTGMTWDRAAHELYLHEVADARSRHAWDLFSLEVEARTLRYRGLDDLASALEQQRIEVPPSSEREGYWLADLFEANDLTDEQWLGVRVQAHSWLESENAWILQALELMREVAPGCDQ